jgi:hypothetical protein
MCSATYSYPARTCLLKASNTIIKITTNTEKSIIGDTNGNPFHSWKEENHDEPLLVFLAAFVAGALDVLFPKNPLLPLLFPKKLLFAGLLFAGLLFAGGLFAGGLFAGLLFALLGVVVPEVLFPKGTRLLKNGTFFAIVFAASFAALFTD